MRQRELALLDPDFRDIIINYSQLMPSREMNQTQRAADGFLQLFLRHADLIPGVGLKENH